MKTLTRRLKYGITVVGIVVLAISVPAIGFGATMCEQMYFLIGKTSGSNSQLAYIMQNTGECEWHVLHRLWFKDNKFLGLESERYGMPDSAFTHETPYTLESAMRMRATDSGFTIHWQPTLVRESTPDSLKLRQLDSLWQWINSIEGEPSQWRQTLNSFTNDSLYFVQMPEVRGIGRPTLIYSDPEGLYYDYRIRDVIFWPESEILWVETWQPRGLTGHDGVHGVMIFHLE